MPKDSLSPEAALGKIPRGYRTFMASPSFQFHRSSLPQVVLYALVLLACSVDFSRRFSIAGVSGLGGLTLAAGGMVWAIWLMRPVLPRGLLFVFLPLILFVVDAVGTLAWYRPAMEGVQLLVVCTSFLCVMMLSARESFADPLLAGRLRILLIATAVFPVFAWAGLLLTHMVSAAESNLSRGFALYTLPVVAAALATWRGYAWPEHGHQPRPAVGSLPWVQSFWPLIWVMVIGWVVMLGMSRTALVIIALLIPLSLVYRGSFSSILKGVTILGAGAASFSAILATNQALYDRFFKEDASMSVGGVSINGTGRTKIWEVLLSTIKDDWLMGKGVSSSEAIIASTFSNVSQPHNDYLRFYYDQGVLGESLWFAFIIGFVVHTIGNLRRSIRNQTPDYLQHLTALLALTGVSLSMTTDNSYCYEFVMFPLAMMMGCSLGLGRYYAMYQSAPLPVQDFYAPPMTPMLSLAGRHSK
jgi:hypothetical protein